MTRKKKSPALLIAVLLTTSIWTFRPYDRADPANVNEAISSLGQPIESVATAYWMDGGSLGFQFTDFDGIVLQACIPEPDYNTLYIGATHPWDDGAVLVEQSQDSILRLLEIVRTHDKPDHQNDLVVAKASR